MVQLWRSLSDPQRRVLFDPNGHHAHYIVCARALDRRGLLMQFRGARSTTGQALVDWAIAAGHTAHDQESKTWTFQTPTHRRLDPRRLSELAASGHHGAEIARLLGVTRQAVDCAAKREGITLPRRPKRERPATRRGEPHPHRLTVPLTAAEMAAVRKMSADAGVSMSELVRQRLLKESA